MELPLASLTFDDLGCHFKVVRDQMENQERIKYKCHCHINNAYERDATKWRSTVILARPRVANDIRVGGEIISAAALIDTYRKHVISHVTKIFKDTFRRVN